MPSSFCSPHASIYHCAQAPVSQASARQRAGRAGRTQPGCCYRLYTEASFHALPLTTPPEMQRASLAWPVLQLKALGVDDVLHFDFVSPPSVASMLHGLEILYSLSALDDQCRLTPEGEVRMVVAAVQERALCLVFARFELTGILHTKNSCPSFLFVPLPIYFASL